MATTPRERGAVSSIDLAFSENLVFPPLVSPSTNENETEESFQSSLKDQLLEAQVDTGGVEHYLFIPIDSIIRIVTKLNIRRELTRIRINQSLVDLEALTDTMHDRSPKFFGILAIIDRTQTIIDFHTAQIFDVDLPLRRSRDLLNSGKSAPKSLNLQSSRGTSILVFRTWTKWKVQEFFRVQWTVLAPVFSSPGQYYDLDDNCILPFIEDTEGQQDMKSGGYSHVWGVRIHPAHQKIFRWGTDMRKMVSIFSRGRRSAWH